MSQHVALTTENGVHHIRFERPDANNALTEEMCDAAANAIANSEHDSRVRVFLLSGTPGVFTSGHDTDELTRYAAESKFGEAPIRLVKMLATIDKPVIAAVDGLVVGFGTALLLHCDYVVASEWSVFSAPFVDHGVSPEAGSSLLAPLAMGYHRAFELIVMGETFDAQRAFQAGLVNRVVPAGEVDEAGLAAARALADKPPEAVRTARRLFRGDSRPLLQRIDLEVTRFAEILRSPAARDALQAYIDRKR
jgi:enoyl-CoA hydratase/carnithine racemase